MIHKDNDGEFRRKPEEETIIVSIQGNEIIDGIRRKKIHELM